MSKRNFDCVLFFAGTTKAAPMTYEQLAMLLGALLSSRPYGSGIWIEHSDDRRYARVWFIHPDKKLEPIGVLYLRKDPGENFLKELSKKIVKEALRRKKDGYFVVWGYEDASTEKEET